MSASNRNGYLLLSRTDEWYQQLSPAELQELLAANKAWVGELFAACLEVLTDTIFDER